jgi:hypothetical protein
MRVGFSGCPARAFKALWSGRSSHRPEDLIEYSSSLKLQLLDFSEETLNLSERDLAEIESMGFSDKQASHFRHLSQLARVGGVGLTLSSSSRLILTAPDPRTNSKSVRSLRALLSVARALRCTLLTVFAGYNHGTPEDSLNRLKKALSTLDIGGEDSPTLGIEAKGYGVGTTDLLAKLCERPGVTPVINLTQCIPRSGREHFDSQFASLLEFAAERSDGRHIFVRYRAEDRRVPVGVSEGWPDFRIVLHAVSGFESLGGPEVCILLDSPRREWDAVLLSSYYHMLGSADATPDDLSPAEIVKAGTPRVVDVGSQVILQDVSRRQQLHYEIVEPGSADPFSDRISYESPIGKSLLGKESGSIVEIAAPGGSYVFRVVDIS